MLVACLVGGFPGLNPKADYENAEMLMYIGSNPMVSHGHNTGMCNPAIAIRGTAARGEVWTIDPLFTETAKFSTRHLAPYPGKDYAILAWLVREILSGGPLKPAQAVTGLEELRSGVGRFTLETAAAIAGVAQQDLTDLLAAIRRKGRIAVETGTGVTMADSANLTHWLSWVLMILTGSMNRRGGVWFHPGSIWFLRFRAAAHRQSVFSRTAHHARGVRHHRRLALRGIARRNRSGTYPRGSQSGRASSARFRMPMCWPRRSDSSRCLPAWKSCRMRQRRSQRTCCPPRTSRTAEISLWDTLASRVSLQHAPAIVPALGERRSGWWVMSQLMKRLGMPLPENVPSDDRLAGRRRRDARRGPVTQGARCTYDEVAVSGYVRSAA